MLFSFVPALFDVNVKEYVDIIFDLIKEHDQFLFGVFTLFIVWETYSAKIISKPELGNRSELPILARSAYNLFEIIFRAWLTLRQSLLPRWKESEDQKAIRLHWHAQAALVAVDMLALAALMKAMGYLDTRELQAGIVVCVFIVVFIFAYFAGRFSTRLFAALEIAARMGDLNAHKAKEWLLITIRLGEPFMIFYFGIQLMAYLMFDGRFHSVIYFAGSAILLYGLISKHSFVAVVKYCVSEDHADDEEIPHLRPIAQLLLEFGGLMVRILKWVLFVALGIAAFLGLLLLIYGNPADFESLDAEISVVFAALSLLSLVFFLVPALTLGKQQLVGIQTYCGFLDCPESF